MAALDLLSLPTHLLRALDALVASDKADARATFEFSMVGAPFFLVAGVEALVDGQGDGRFEPSELAWLQAQGIFRASTAKTLQSARIACNIDSVREGTVIGPYLPFLAIEGPHWQALFLANLFERCLEAAVCHASHVARLMARHQVLGFVDDLTESAPYRSYAALGSALAAARGDATPNGLNGPRSLGFALLTTNLDAGRNLSLPMVFEEPNESDISTFEAPRGENMTLIRRASHVHRTPTLIELAKRGLAQSRPDFLLIELDAFERRTLGHEISEAFEAAGLTPPRTVIRAGSALADLDGFALTGDANLDCIFTSTGASESLAGMRIQRHIVALEEQGRWTPKVTLGATKDQSSDAGRKTLMRYRSASGELVCDVAHSTHERVQPAHDVAFIERATGFTRTIRAQSSEALRANLMRGGLRVTEAEKFSQRQARAHSEIAALSARYAAGGRRLAEAPLPYGLSASLALQKEEQLALIAR